MIINHWSLVHPKEKPVKKYFDFGSMKMPTDPIFINHEAYLNDPAIDPIYTEQHINMLISKGMPTAGWVPRT